MSTQTGSSQEYHPPTEAKNSGRDVEEAHEGDANDQEACSLFHDDSHSNDHDVNGPSDDVEKDNLSVNVEQLMKPPGLVAPETPNSRYQSGNNATGPPNNLFLPPREVTIDPYAVPPSPIKDPSVAFQGAHEDQGLLLMNLGNAQQHRSHEQEQCQLLTPELHPDPGGDVVLRRQLLDAHRLVPGNTGQVELRRRRTPPSRHDQHSARDPFLCPHETGTDRIQKAARS
jgi:hypothetical protein